MCKCHFQYSGMLYPWKAVRLWFLARYWNPCPQTTAKWYVKELYLSCELSRNGWQFSYLFIPIYKYSVALKKKTKFDPFGLRTWFARNPAARTPKSNPAAEFWAAQRGAKRRSRSPPVGPSRLGPLRGRDCAPSCASPGAAGCCRQRAGAVSSGPGASHWGGRHIAPTAPCVSSRGKAPWAPASSHRRFPNVQNQAWPKGHEKLEKCLPNKTAEYRRVRLPRTPL